MNINKKINIIETILFVIIWTGIMLLGADFPPPSGFWKIIFLIIVLAGIQYIYLTYLFRKMLVMKTFIKNILFFLLGGIITSIVSILFFGTEIISKKNFIICTSMITMVSIIYGICFWSINYLLKRKYK